MFKDLPEKAADDGVTKELALQILKGAREPANGLRLFELASKTRDERLGKNPTGLRGYLR